MEKFIMGERVQVVNVDPEYKEKYRGCEGRYGTVKLVSDSGLIYIDGMDQGFFEPSWIRKAPRLPEHYHNVERETAKGDKVLWGGYVTEVLDSGTIPQAQGPQVNLGITVGDFHQYILGTPYVSDCILVASADGAYKCPAVL